jgi:uncharacterized protein (DUF1800 family)
MVATALRPISQAQFGYDQAAHLLHRAGFGAQPRQVARLAAMGPNKAVDALLDFTGDDPTDPADFDPDILKPLTPDQRRALTAARRQNNEKILAQFQARRNEQRKADRRQLRQLQRWWLQRMARSPDPLREKLTLFWHGHFATNYRGCPDSYLLYQQNQLFREHAAGSFAELARRIVRDPAMIVFLNNDRNRKASPNENLARELMELFTLGEGQYRESDIKHGARALTGYTRDDNDFEFNKPAHDPGGKRILGRHGAFDGDDFVRICLSRQACAPFIAGKLYRFFAADLPDEPGPRHQPVINALARTLRGNDYQLKPMLRELFLSEHFYSEQIRGRLIKSPAQLLVGLIRQLGIDNRNMDYLIAAMRLMGQEPFNPPNVAGWPGGRAWINTSTLFVRHNLATYLITGQRPNGRRTNRAQPLDPMPLIEDLINPDARAVVDHLAGALIATPLVPARRTQLLDFMKQQNGRVDRPTLIALLCLITAMPEFQLC